MKSFGALLLASTLCFALVQGRSWSSFQTSGEKAHQHLDASTCVTRALHPLRDRTDIGPLLEAEGFTTGAELGVQHGHFAAHTLHHWPSCSKYYLVDVWATQDNYLDEANTADQESIYNSAMANVAEWKDRVETLRMFTTEAANLIPDNSLDYVYVDARHDYCGVASDLAAYWPKLKPNGILAGHDYLNSDDLAKISPGQNWSVCGNGTVVQGAVKGAVNDFAEAHGLTVTLFAYVHNDWPSFGIRKPCGSTHA